MTSVLQKIAGHCGLFMSNEPADKVLAWFASYGESDYPRSGFESTEDVSLEEGPLPQFSHAIEPHLRQLGMPTELKQGVVNIRHKYQVCRKGDVLTPDQCKILVRVLSASPSSLPFSKNHPPSSKQNHALTHVCSICLVLFAIRNCWTSRWPLSSSPSSATGTTASLSISSLRIWKSNNITPVFKRMKPIGGSSRSNNALLGLRIPRLLLDPCLLHVLANRLSLWFLQVSMASVASPLMELVSFGLSGSILGQSLTPCPPFLIFRSLHSIPS